MDLALTDEQSRLRETVRSFLKNLCTKEWLDKLEHNQVAKDSTQIQRNIIAREMGIRL